MRDSPARWHHEIELSPAFHDIDPMLVVWHGNYVRYVEIARCALLQQLDYDYPQMQASGYMWPVVDMRMKYVRPIRYGQRVKIHAEIVEWEHRLKIEYRISDAATGEKLTTGYTVQVSVDATTGEMQFVSPKVLFDCLGLAHD